ncbi:MAG: PAS domain S-box protein [Chloroflexi bacterium]|nr:PAS domain S-box protein [Chloroflexota bacterium]
MKIKISYMKLILVGASLGILYWIIQSALDAFVFYETGFFSHLIPSDPYQVWMRLIIIGFIIGFSVYAQVLIYRWRHAEETRRKSEEWLYTMLQSMGEAVIATDTKDKITFMNPVAEDLTGWKEKEAAGKSLDEVFNVPAEKDAWGPARKALRKGLSAAEGQKILISKDGPGRPIEEARAPIRDDAGSVIGTVIIFRDISYRVQAEEKLRTSEEKYRLLFANMNEGVALHEILYDADRVPVDYIITDVNPAFEKIVGIAPSDAVGKKATELYGVEPAPHIDIYSKVAETGKPAAFETYFPPMDKHFSISAFSTAAGRFATVFFDITARKKAEENLKRKQEELQIILDSVPAMIFYKNRMNRFILINNALAEATGLPREEIENKTAFEVYPRQAVDYLKDDNEVMDSGTPKRGIIEPMETTTGIKWLRTDKIPYRDEKGNIIGILGFALDITKQRQAEESMRESWEWLSTTLRSIGDAVIATDTDAKVTFMNPVAESLTGWKQRDAAGKPLEKVFNIINEKTGKPVESPVDTVIREGVIIGLANHTVLISKDGTRYPIDDSGAPIRDDKGKITGVVMVFRDITERRKSLETLRESEVKYRSLVEGLSDAIYRMSLPDGKYEYMGPAANSVFGYNSEKFLDNPLLIKKIIHPDYARYFEDRWEDLIEGRVPPTYEYKVIDPEGKERWIIQSNRGIYDDAGKIIGIEGVCRNITGRKHAEERILHLNTAIRAIRNINQLIIREKDLDQLLQKSCEALVESKGYYDASINLQDGEGKFFSASQPEQDKKDRPMLEMMVHLAHEDKVYGTLSASIPSDLVDAEDQTLLVEVGNDIAFALYGIEVENSRRRAEEALLDEKNRVREYLDIAGVIIVAIDASGVVSLINKKGCEVLGAAEAEVLGKNWFDNFIPERLRGDVKETFHKLLTGKIEPAEYFENPVLAKSGEEKVIFWHNAVLKDDEGNITGTLSSGEDVTWRKK